MPKKISIIVLGTIAILLATISLAQDRIVIGTGLKYPLVNQGEKVGFLDAVVRDAFRRQGIELEIIILPAARVLINANQGVEDGCLLRIKGLEKYYPNLVRVPERLMISEFVAYSTSKIDSRVSIEKYTPYSIAYITGWKIFDRLFDKHPSVTRVKEAVQMFDLLKLGRVDVVLYEKWQGLGLLNQMKVKNVNPIDPPLVSMDMFMYLHKKHRSLTIRIASILSDMKKDGTYLKYYNHYLTTNSELTSR